MISDIGLMIGGYIIFRCIELACHGRSHYDSLGAQNAVRALAVFGILGTAFLIIDLLLSGTSRQPTYMVPSAGIPSGVTCPEHLVADVSGKCVCGPGYHSDLLGTAWMLPGGCIEDGAFISRGAAR